MRILYLITNFSPLGRGINKKIPKKNMFKHRFSTYFTICTAISVRFKPLQAGAGAHLGFSREGGGTLNQGAI